MPLTPECPRCPQPVSETGAGWACEEHGEVVPLWRPDEVAYDAFAEHLGRATAFPSYLPWPMSPGWSVSDFGVVCDGSTARATVTCCSGSTDPDGAVDVMVVAEEPGTGLGARCAGTVSVDPGREVGDGPALAHVRIDRHPYALWAVSTSASSRELDRMVLVGEAAGRWLWLVVRPASAVLLLREEWILRDASALGPPLVEVPFGGVGPVW